MSALSAMSGPSDVPLESPLLSMALDQAQEQGESYFYGMRKEVFEYDQVLDSQRSVIYGKRQAALLGCGEEVEQTMLDFGQESMVELVDELTSATAPVSEWRFSRMAQKLAGWFSGMRTPSEETLRDVAGAGGRDGQKQLQDLLTQKASRWIQEKLKLIDRDGPMLGHAVFRQIWLQQIDKFWQRHLQNMDYLKTSVFLRAIGQQRPLVEYKREGFELFQDILGRIRRNAVYNIFLFMPQPLVPLEHNRLRRMLADEATPPELNLSSDGSVLLTVKERLQVLENAGEKPLLRIQDTRESDRTRLLVRSRC
eukprot:4939188-Amphidinium_carterae.1